MRHTPTIPPPPYLPTIPDHPAPLSVRFGPLRIALPAAVVAALVSAAATAFATRAVAPSPPGGRDDVAELRGDVKALQATVSALTQAQRELLERINREEDAARNDRLVEALKARGGQ